MKLRPAVEGVVHIFVEDVHCSISLPKGRFFLLYLPTINGKSRTHDIDVLRERWTVPLGARIDSPGI